MVNRQLDVWRGDAPVVMTADFNARARDTGSANLESLPDELRRWLARDPVPPAGGVYNLFRDYGFVDTFDEAGLHDAPDINTYHHFLGRGFPSLGYRIDWILTLDGAQRWQTRACQIIRDEAPPLYPSDHYPVLAEIALG